MIRSLIVVGNARRHFDAGQHLAAYLRELGLQPSFLPTAYHTVAELEEKLKEFLGARPDEPVLLSYAGHGTRGHWNYAENGHYPYPALAGLLAYRTAPTVIINDCCHALSIVDALVAARVPEERVSVIASAPKDDISYAGMTARVVASWKQGKAHEPTLERVRTETIESITYVPSVISFLQRKTGLRLKAFENRRIRSTISVGVRETANRFLPKEFRIPVIDELYMGPPGYGIGPTSLVTEVDERRWGSEFDSLFFLPPRPAP